ncbi:M48 family metalloprotease [Streptomyces clavuligerus]|uniref:Peptidase M48 Ste24p n=3 Tax=Streptomyces clavuligerus TaxID=1901 RepID=E2Q0H5_STRCL|nr:M48 family metallopeptidase [Streptomyces clavuligerus]ANW16956.1 peptidase [Streptomyces clavuligerus]AXU11485.1 peptidase [Streptomyces clavuligerus]EFG10518.1 peptidase M48 Ste24p [Streptomyces clavuligerus]MBY6301304.1 M48 family metalloprotease [Streptomyces clavuligerus]QCS04357.1 peptidase [Streptomyces clavuligerus]
MGATVRAVRALALLAGFHLLGVLLLAVLGGIDYLLYLFVPAGIAAKLYVISVLLAIPVIRGMFMLRVPRGGEPDGVRVTEADEPELWRTVRELAEQVGTRAPTEIVLTAEVNAAVLERTRLLGLLPGPRTLFLGVPLTQGLGEAQLRAVIVHELGHYANSDTRLAAITVRGRAQILRTVRHFEERAGNAAEREREKLRKKARKAEAKGRTPQEVPGEDTPGRAGVTYRVMARIYTAYARFFLRATLTDARRQEYAADLASARIAGREATASALREIPALAAAHDFYLHRYATMGIEAELLPPRGEFFGGFGHLLSARALELLRMRGELPDGTVSPYDSHPPLADRVRRVEALDDDGRTDENTGTALALLADPGHTLTALEDAVLAPGIRALPRARDWQDLLERSMHSGLADHRSPLHQALARYTGRPATLSALLGLIDEGRLWKLAQRMPLSDEAARAEGRAFREFVRPSLHSSVSGMVLAELGSHNLLRWEFSWSEAARARFPKSADGQEQDLDAAVGAAVADAPDTRPLRALLPGS